MPTFSCIRNVVHRSCFAARNAPDGDDDDDDDTMSQASGSAAHSVALFGNHHPAARGRLGAGASPILLCYSTLSKSRPHGSHMCACSHFHHDALCASWSVMLPSASVIYAHHNAAYIV